MTLSVLRKSVEDPAVYVANAELDRFPVILLGDEDGQMLEDAFGAGGDVDWKPVRGEIIGAGVGVLPDFPGCSSGSTGFVTCFSERASDALAAMLLPNGRLFEIDVMGARFFAYKIDCVLDALDTDASRFELAGGPRLIAAHVFKPDVLDAATIFHLPLGRPSADYVTQQFVDAVAAHGLSGFRFAKVWDGSQPVVGSGLFRVGW